MRSETKGLAFALLNFFIASTLGLILRYAFVAEIPWLDFRVMMHGHVNLAMLGWLYPSLYLLLGFSFIDNFWSERIYRRLFWSTGLTVILMVTLHILLPTSGYSFIVTFIFLLQTYLFAFLFIKDVRKNREGMVLSTRFAYTSVAFFVFATIGLIITSIIQLMGLKHGILYYMANQFFLHFQFHGFLIFGALAILFRFFRQNQIAVDLNMVRTFYKIFIVATFLTYALALTWGSPHWSLFLVNSLGVLIQLISLGWFYVIMRSRIKTWHKKVSKNFRWLFGVAFFSFCLKILIQSAVIVPYIAQVAYTIRNYVIGFIHLIMLGVMSAVILAFCGRRGWLDLKEPLTRIGLFTLFGGFALSEIILILQGTMFWGVKGLLPYYYEGLFVVSFLMPLGILIILISIFINRKSKQFQVV